MIPKSLHTVTALVNVGLHLWADAAQRGVSMGTEYAVDRAAAILGYDDAGDTYGLKTRAAALLAREVQS
jgi:hypothetical protein